MNIRIGQLWYPLSGGSYDVKIRAIAEDQIIYTSSGNPGITYSKPLESFISLYFNPDSVEGLDYDS